VVSFGLIGYIFYSLYAAGKLRELPDYFASANYWWLLAASLLLLGLLAAGSLRWGLILCDPGNLSEPGECLYVLHDRDVLE